MRSLIFFKNDEYMLQLKTLLEKNLKTMHINFSSNESKNLNAPHEPNAFEIIEIDGPLYISSFPGFARINLSTKEADTTLNKGAFAHIPLNSISAILVIPATLLPNQHEN